MSQLFIASYFMATANRIESQRLAIYSPRAKFGHYLFFLDKVLLDHSHSLFKQCLSLTHNGMIVVTRTVTYQA